MNEKKPNYLVLVNENNRLPEDFEASVEFVVAQNAEGTEYTLEKKTYEAFLRMRAHLMEHDGMQIELISTYRSLAQQEAVFASNVERYGLEHTKKYVSNPGHSEHHTGLAIDVSVMVDGKIPRARPDLFAIDHLLKRIHKKLPQYGFLLRYLEGKEAVTKIGYEPWHLRYIDSPEIAREIADKGICFEEYWQK